MYSEISDNEYAILENIYGSSGESRSIKQRDLSRIAGTSLGMTNSILKRLTQKGWITIRKLNSRNIQYAVTLEGLNEIMRRSYRYFKRTIKNAVYYKESLEEIIRRQKARNITAVILVGYSDLDFIVEHACRREGISFLKAADTETVNGILKADTFRIYAENIEASAGVTAAQGAGELRLPARETGAEDANSFYLSRLLIKHAAGK